jgi:hypothetical protein
MNDPGAIAPPIARQMERVLERLLLCVVRSTNDPRRAELKTEGMDERDLAVEAGFLTPAAVDDDAYTPTVRRPILAALQVLEQRGWIEVVSGDRWHIMRVRPTAAGESYAMELQRPWYRKLRDRLWGSSFSGKRVS